MTEPYYPPIEGEPPAPRRRGRGLLKLGAFFLSLLLVFAGFGAYALTQARGSATGRDVTVEIAQGSTASSIADQLARNGVIRSAWLFKVMARFRGTASSLKPGEYKMRTGMSFSAVLDLLENGPAVPFVRVTVPEGRTVGQVADIVTKTLGISRAAFVSASQSGKHRIALQPAGSMNLEGLLYPETFFFKTTDTADDVIDRLLAQFVERTADLDYTKSRSHGLSQYQTIILASLVEREARIQEDRPRIAGVIYNRLKRGMQLQLDATVQYAMYLRDGRMPTEIQENDLKINSPYNTYKIAGLPPAPIASPGIASLRAAVDPEANDYLYYVLSTDQKRHCFAKTYNEFLAYKNRTRSCV